eukprot:10790237-Heterocapsa_arctica.AAC.1
MRPREARGTLHGAVLYAALMVTGLVALTADSVAKQLLLASGKLRSRPKPSTSPRARPRATTTTAGQAAGMPQEELGLQALRSLRGRACSASQRARRAS